MASHNVGIIGCGVIGARRAEILKKFPAAKLVKVADINPERAKALAEQNKCAHTTDWHEVTQDPQISQVIVSTTNNLLAEATIDAIKHGKHVLVEKPAARNLDELNKVIAAYESLAKKPVLKAGFNHRFHPAFQKAKEIIATQGIGEIMFIRARYGHGARVGYDKEWRSKKEVSGGGELLDQGVHVIDLARYFMGDFERAVGHCETFFWKNGEVEDNCFALMKTPKGQIASFHVSTTQWKNIFSMEIFCKTGQINIDGLGKSYGKETLTFYKMKPEMGPPDKEVYDWEGDDSWEKEYADFISAIEQNKEPNGTIYDVRAALKLVSEIYSKPKLL